jgi:6-phosphogluconolactonase
MQGTAANRYVYVGTYTAPHTAPGGPKPSLARGIYVFRMDGSTGALSQVQVVEVDNPSWLTLDARGRFLYAVNEVRTWKGQTNSGGVSSFSVDAASGELTFLNDQPTMGADSTHVAIDPTGRWLLTSNYTGGNFTLLPIQSNGQVGQLSNVFAPTGMGPNIARQESPHAHQARFDPGGTFGLGADLGLDRLWSWRIDGSAGKFVANRVPYIQVASGSGARHFDFHPSGKFLYVIGEMENSITAFTYDARTGTAIWLQTIATLPTNFSGASTTAEVAVHPSGRWLYGSNRGHGSIVSFGIDQATGKLASPSWVLTQGTVPRGFGIDPSGTLLLVGNSDADTVIPFSIDQSSGTLTPTGAVTQTPVPVSFAFGASLTGR